MPLGAPDYVSKPTAGDMLGSSELLPASGGLTRRRCRMKISCVAVVAISILLCACSQERQFSEEVLLSDGRIIYAESEEVVGPNEFLIPGEGQTRQITIAFKLPSQTVIWPGSPSNDKPGSVFPITFDVLDSTPVVVLSVYYNCQGFNKASDVLVPYAFNGRSWHQIDLDGIPLTWRRNLVQHSDRKHFRPGRVYTIEDKNLRIAADPADHSQRITLEHEVDSYRRIEKGLEKRCAQLGVQADR